MKQKISWFLISALSLGVVIQFAFAQNDQRKTGKMSVAAPLEAARLAQFESLLDGLRQELKIPALSAAIVKDQKVLWAKGFG